MNKTILTYKTTEMIIIDNDVTPYNGNLKASVIVFYNC